MGFILPQLVGIELIYPMGFSFGISHIDSLNEAMTKTSSSTTSVRSSSCVTETKSAQLLLGDANVESNESRPWM